MTTAGYARIEHAYELFRDGQLLTSGATTLVCLDRDGRPQPMPETLHLDKT